MELVAPIIPDAQRNLAAGIAVQAIGQGLQAAAQFARMRRESESDVMRIAAQERMAADEHELKKQQLDQTFEIQDRNMTMNEELLPSRKLYFESAANNRKRGLQDTIDFNLQREALVAEVNDTASKLKLNDPKFITESPVQFAKNVQDFEDMWKMSPLPDVKERVKQYREAAEEQKIPLRMGMHYDTAKKAWMGGTAPQMVPLIQIYKNLQDPLTQDATMQALEANGHVKVLDEVVKITEGPHKGETKTYKNAKREIAPGPVNEFLKKGGDVDFKEHLPSRVPPVMLRKGDARGTAPTELPELDIPPDGTSDPQASAQPVFEPTQKDTMLSHAKAAIAKGAPMPAVAARLAELGIDPSQLWAS